MTGYTPRLKKILAAAGCYKEKQGKGDHETWFSPISKRYFTVDGNIKSRHTANETLKQAGLEKQF
jgi:HicA toxin of bacterial toxin-antitoxin,